MAIKHDDAKTASPEAAEPKVDTAIQREDLEAQLATLEAQQAQEQSRCNQLQAALGQSRAQVLRLDGGCEAIRRILAGEAK